MVFSKEVGEALTFKFAQAANEMKAQGREIISLGLGEPDFKTPQYVIDATTEALMSGCTHYSASQGLPELRNLIANDLGTYPSSQIIITPGIKAAVYFSLAAILEPEDSVILISPYYVSYPAMIKLAEPTAHIINVPLLKNFSLDIESLEIAFTKKPKCILLNTPHNPTGMMLSEIEILKIVELAIKNNTYIISDEVYDKLAYEGNTHHSFAEYPNAKELTIVANGYSKSYAMTGWRLGYAAGPQSVIAKMNKLQLHINTNTCTFVQKGACAIYQNEPTHIRPYVQTLQDRMQYFHKEINSIDYFRGQAPKGGFFYFADISKTGLDSNSLCVKLLQETGIATTPGIAFGPKWDDHIRFSLSVDKTVLEKAICLMKKFKI